MIPMISPLVIWEATNEPLETQLLLGSAKENAAATSTTARMDETTMSRLVISGVLSQSGISPTGPVAAPSMAPSRGALEVSRSWWR